MSESLADAVSRLLDSLYRNHYELITTVPALREAVEMARLAYERERAARGEYATEYPTLGGNH